MKMKISDNAITMLDPSLLLRPEKIYDDKPIEAFRNYDIDENDIIKQRVKRTYYEMHSNQTYDFVQSKMEKWLKFKHFKSTVKDALIKLNELVDESDPDTDLPNIVHAFQTAESIRQDHPHDDWFHLTGLIHDLGKTRAYKGMQSIQDQAIVTLTIGIALTLYVEINLEPQLSCNKVMAFYEEPQWCVVGDTFPVGCQWGPNIVYGNDSFKDNPDTYNPKYNTEFGIYKPKCGIEQLVMSWGHDEYLYRVLKHNRARLPREGLWMIRYHSFYPWHAGGDYHHLTTEEDEKIKEAVLTFNKYDLYTKSAGVPDIEALWPYYEGLIDKYIPGELEW